MTRYRLTRFNRPAGEWRETRDEVIADARAAGLAAYDRSKREWFVPVPGGVEREN